jgi:hypothetical protein
MSAALTVITGDPATPIFELRGPSLAAQLIVQLVGAGDCSLQLVEPKYWMPSRVAPAFRLIYLEFITYLLLCQNTMQTVNFDF